MRKIITTAIITAGLAISSVPAFATTTKPNPYRAGRLCLSSQLGGAVQSVSGKTLVCTKLAHHDRWEPKK